MSLYCSFQIYSAVDRNPCVLDFYPQSFSCCHLAVVWRTNHAPVAPSPRRALRRPIDSLLDMNHFTWLIDWLIFFFFLWSYDSRWCSAHSAGAGWRFLPGRAAGVLPARRFAVLHSNAARRTGPRSRQRSHAQCKLTISCPSRLRSRFNIGFYFFFQSQSKYKSLLISERTTIDDLIELLLRCHGNNERIERFSIYEVCTRSHDIHYEWMNFNFNDWNGVRFARFRIMNTSGSCIQMILRWACKRRGRHAACSHPAVRPPVRNVSSLSYSAGIRMPAAPTRHNWPDVA